MVRYLCAVTMVVGVWLAGVGQAEAEFTFSDIQTWTGSGANQAAVVVDWKDGKNPLAWGYRWDGAATGQDMLLAIVQADNNAYVRVDAEDPRWGRPIYGIGYDRNQSGFSISDGTSFPAGGVVQTGVPDQFGPGATSEDPDDSYGEGWLSGPFWGYWLGSGDPFSGGAWTGANTGPFGETLSNGEWNGYAFGPFPTPPPGEPNLVPEPASLAMLAGLLVSLIAFSFRRREVGV